VETDLIIVGGGPVGASLACATGGLRAALVAAGRPATLPRDAPFDARVYALSPGNVAFLRELGVWQAMPQERLAPVHAMRVCGDDGASAIKFDAWRAGVPELAWIVEDAALQEALWRSLDARGGLERFAPASCETIDIGAEGVALRLGDGRSLAARLIVGADGARSLVRDRAGIAAAERPYGQKALTANFACERPHRGTAWQWFRGGPVLALLPLPGERVSMVWSLPEAEAERIAALAPQTLCREVETASRGALGALSLESPVRGYALRRLAARRLVAPRVALAGDAGHVVHPLAGQGLNLGLQDARALAATLAAREPGRDPGDVRLLRRYERARAEPVLAMDAMVDGLWRLFGVQGELVSRLRNAGLRATDRLPAVKNLLARQAMR
jgi:ubiquinone biosynthesis UbiH/UbiF/VisC/COQ6 family hydroxylase